MDVLVTKLRVLKHTEVTGKLKASSNKKRKAHQQLIRQVIENVLDTGAQKQLNKQSIAFYRAARAEKYRAKYGIFTYAANGVDIVDYK